jgi:putative flippase GtrA
VIAKALNNSLTSRFPDRGMFWQLVRYLITGCSSAALEVALFVLLANVIFVGITPPQLNSDPKLYFEVIQRLMAMGVIVADKFNVFYANAVSLTVAFWFTFLVNRLFSFRSKAPILGQLGIYTPLFFFNLAATSIIVGFLVTSMELLPVVAKTVSIGCTVSWNFLIYKFLIFR